MVGIIMVAIKYVRRHLKLSVPTYIGIYLGKYACAGIYPPRYTLAARSLKLPTQGSMLERSVPHHYKYPVPSFDMSSECISSSSIVNLQDIIHPSLQDLIHLSCPFYHSNTDTFNITIVVRHGAQGDLLFLAWRRGPDCRHREAERSGR